MTLYGSNGTGETWKVNIKLLPKAKQAMIEQSIKRLETGETGETEKTPVDNAATMSGTNFIYKNGHWIITE